MNQERLRGSHVSLKLDVCVVLTFGVGQEAVESRDVASARGDSEGVVLRDVVSRGNTCTPREIMASGIWGHMGQTNTDVKNCTKYIWHKHSRFMSACSMWNVYYNHRVALLLGLGSGLLQMVWSISNTHFGHFFCSGIAMVSVWWITGETQAI